jgi:hypothetical protein
MQPFIVPVPTDEHVQVPFRVPVKDGEPIEFSIRRMNFIDEPTMRKIRDDLKKLDDEVPQTYPNGEPVWKQTINENDEWVDELDDDGKKIRVFGPPQRSQLERVRAVAEVMLKVLVPAATFKRLQKLTTGELDAIINHWTVTSFSKLETPDGDENQSLGESSASSTS